MQSVTMDDRGVILPCPACGQKNRTPFDRLGEMGTCGKCKAPLPPLSVPVAVDSESVFDRLTSSSSLPVVVDFWAPWCAPCRQMAPELAKVAASGAGKFVVTQVNTEALPNLAQRFDIRSIPTLAVFAHGREAGRSAGARPASAIESFIRTTLGSA